MPMQPKRDHLGYGRHVNPSSDKWLSPQGPQTGDGRTRRSTFDRVQLAFTKVATKDTPPRR